MSLYQKQLGKIGEQRAEDYLKNNDFTIVKKNFRTYRGEIDIIAKKQNCLYFIEVKTRSNLKKGQPWEAVNKIKIHHIKKAVDYFLLKYGYRKYKLKISVISVLLGDDEEIKFFDNVEC
ncbi:YraN family protein [Candidatus Roizmanbacteria bacterium CG_4_10_14_0_2_um_filter_36_35]|uniref:UPF0102 protein COS50_00475 n=3 Tax=Candidatus Roizmaniibacteriota TaxID=1752723 RepID=A0A2M7BXS1_9BACT|nr:MAG: YraN family protein [Candidatus Roizmanbacteria bacterium CG11_big_fil_rev_8_21_14_0_20_35_14]PIV11358.1 MAG: YraN family protein [Candidatus Roizmanbacteria bacterium CG03_land_8_20_14_0_80_35_26]PIZ68762.1 MAG: YraN family protein [Candidatus Roizmanbacteria bacterium CG_4_10_14_0_2_um_filter_36_35]